MPEYSNKAIAVNSSILFIRLIVTAICAILTTRFALQALGVSDFGLFSLLGGLISFVLIINTIMLSATNRFIAYSLGKGDLSEANIQFNVNLVIHVAIAIVTLIVSIPLGNWYIYGFVNYDGDLQLANAIYRITIIGSVLSFLGVPYNGLLMAKERFIVFCATDIVSHILKLITAYVLLYFFEEKLLIYTIAQAVLSAYPFFVYYWFCKKQYSNIVSFRFVRDRYKYKEVCSFSVWVAYGAIATVGKEQGSSVIINAFFNTTMNTALGVANSIFTYIQLFVQNISSPVGPQITKSYASGDMERCNQLLVVSNKLCFMLMLLTSIPFFVQPDWIFHIWLGEIPPFASQFLILLIVDALLGAAIQGIANVIFASGKIAIYQISINTLRLTSIIVAYFFLKNGGEAYSLLYAYIIFSAIIIFVSLYIFSRVIRFSVLEFCKLAYIPSCLVLISCLPVILLPRSINPIIDIILSLFYTAMSILFLGLSKKERNYLLSFLRSYVIKSKKSLSVFMH